MVEVATAAGVGVETLRKIESGRVPTPAFFTVMAVAAELDVDPALLVRWACTASDEAGITAEVSVAGPIALGTGLVS